SAGEPGAPHDRGRRLAGVEGARYPSEQRGHASFIERHRRALALRKDELDRYVALADDIAAAHRVHAAALAAMEEELDVVLLAHVERVFDQDAGSALVELDQAPVLDRVVEAHVAVVPALEAVLVRRRKPQAAAGARLRQPHEVAARHR